MGTICKSMINQVLYRKGFIDLLPSFQNFIHFYLEQKKLAELFIKIMKIIWYNNFRRESPIVFCSYKYKWYWSRYCTSITGSVWFDQICISKGTNATINFLCDSHLEYGHVKETNHWFSRAFHNKLLWR